MSTTLAAILDWLGGLFYSIAIAFYTLADRVEPGAHRWVYDVKRERTDGL